MQQRLILGVLVIGLLSGCAAAVVGGAAAGAKAAHDRRSVGTMVDDAGIEFAAVNNLYSNDDITTRDHIKVVAHNGWVLLAGEVTSAEKIPLAESIVDQIQGVRNIVNELEVMDQSGVIGRGHDTYLTARVKAALFGVDIEGFDPSRVNVTTVRDVAYLMGLVTEAEGDAAAERARRVPGVARVVKVFEYVD